MMTLALLAGGLATRMYPLTQKIPKSMLEVAGEPFIGHQLRLLRRKGIERVVLCAGHLGEQIAEYVGNGHQFGLEVIYSFEKDKLLGTGGALRKALPMLGDAFFIMYGDSYLDIDFKAVQDKFYQSHALGAMTVLKNNNQWDQSNIIYINNCIIKYDKKYREPAMQYIDYGLGILYKHVLAEWPADKKFDLAEVYQTLVQKKQLAGIEVQRRFYEIGSVSGLKETEEYLCKQEKTGEDYG
jgi:NDP-sugar pyrophosphorylase family protein